MASTRRGADLLSAMGWESRCHTRKEKFPVLDQDGWMHGPMEEALRLSDLRGAAAMAAERVRLSSSEGHSLSQIDEEVQVCHPCTVLPFLLLKAEILLFLHLE